VLLVLQDGTKDCFVRYFQGRTLACATQRTMDATAQACGTADAPGTTDAGHRQCIGNLHQYRRGYNRAARADSRVRGIGHRSPSRYRQTAPRVICDQRGS
jgi:hypothetical protein